MDTRPAATRLTPHPEADLADLGFIDTASPAITRLMEMVAAMSQATDPSQVMEGFIRGMWQARGPTPLVTITCKGLKPGSYKIMRQIGYDGVNRAPTNDPWGQGHLLPLAAGGFIAQVIATPTPKLARDLRVNNDPVLGDWLSEFRSMIAIPAYSGGTAANWAILLKREPDAFGLADLEEHIVHSNLIAANVINTVMNKQLRDLNAKMQREVERIARIQRALLPRVLPHITGLKIAASYETYDVAGGDMYDFVCLIEGGPGGRGDPDARWAFMIADVSGHGPGAAVLAAMLNAILYSFAKPPDRPSELLNFANQHLCNKRIEDGFVTAILAIYEPRSRRFMFSRAGHPPAIIKTPGKPLTHLRDGGELPMGLTPDVTYTDQTVILEPGQTLVLYTDGIPESFSPQGKLFGMAGIERALNQSTGEPDCVVRTLNEALRTHEGGLQPADDQTILALRVGQ